MKKKNPELEATSSEPTKSRKNISSKLYTHYTMNACALVVRFKTLGKLFNSSNMFLQGMVTSPVPRTSKFTIRNRQSDVLLEPDKKNCQAKSVRNYQNPLFVSTTRKLYIFYTKKKNNPEEIGSVWVLCDCYVLSSCLNNIVTLSLLVVTVLNLSLILTCAHSKCIHIQLTTIITCATTLL